MTETLMCLSCAREIPRADVHQIAVNGCNHGPFCSACAQSAEGIPFDQWLDEQWQRQRPH